MNDKEKKHYIHGLCKWGKQQEVFEETAGYTVKEVEKHTNITEFLCGYFEKWGIRDYNDDLLCLGDAEKMASAILHIEKKFGGE